MKITYVVTRVEPIGGVQVHIRDLAVALRGRGHETSVVTGGGGPFVDTLRADGIPVTVLQHLCVPIRPVSDVLALREIHEAVQRLRPDLLALHSSKAGILGRIAARSLRIPAVLTAHGWSFTSGVPVPRAVVYRQIERLFSPLLSKIITVSESDRQLGIDARIAPEDRLVAVYNGMPDIPQRLRADPARTPVRLVMVARFEDQKDHPTLLRALAGLLEQQWELVLIGDGPRMPEMKAQAATLGLGDRVQFLGQRKDVDQLLATAQVSLLVSNWEGFPLSILESMRAGLPVVATAVGGIGESVHEGETGFLIPRGDIELLRRRIRELVAASDLRARLGGNGRRLYERQFTLEPFVTGTLAVYQEVLAAARSSRPVVVEHSEVLHQ